MAHKPWKYLGFYGCEGRLVRVATTKRAESLGQNGLRRTPGQNHIIECPSCGTEHRVEVSWRHPHDHEKQKQIDVRL